jgi:hypothetical protein
MRKLVTILRVEKTDKHIVQVWRIVRNDDDPSCVGEVTACGLPARAADLPIGTTYKTVLTIPAPSKADLHPSESSFSLSSSSSSKNRRPGGKV